MVLVGATGSGAARPVRRPARRGGVHGAGAPVRADAAVDRPSCATCPHNTGLTHLRAKAVWLEFRLEPVGTARTGSSRNSNQTTLPSAGMSPVKVYVPFP